MSRCLILLFLMCPVLAFAGANSGTKAGSAEYIIEETPGTKVLNVSRLELAPGTKLIELLELFPELLSREGDDRLENYDVQVNGISSGVSKESVLYQYLASDIESVAVSQSPSMAQQVRGQGAVINVTLKALDEGLSGEAALQAGTLAYVMPSANINYKNKRFSLRGSVIMAFEHPRNNTTKESFDQGELHFNTLTDTVNRNFGYELAKVLMDFRPDKRNYMKAWAWESFSRNNLGSKLCNITPLIYKSESDELQDRFSFSAGYFYRHSFDKSSLSTQIEYSYLPYTDDYKHRSLSGIDVLKYCNGSRSRALSGFTSYTYNFQVCDLTAGVNYKWSPVNLSYVETLPDDSEINFNSRVGTVYVSPYLEASAVLGPVQLSAGVRYQNYFSRLDITGAESSSQSESDAAAFFKLGWQIKAHHYINFVLDRSTVRPDARQKYPYTYYDASIRHYVRGNSELKPLGLHSASLNYIFDSSKAKHDFVTSATIQYIKASNIICNTYSVDCNSYVNDGEGDILSANAMAYYRYGVLSVNLNFNLFQNWTHIQGNYDNYFYYNISLVPVLSFNKGWRITPKLIYHSSIVTDTSKLSDYLYAHLNLSKSFGKWTLYAEYQDIFHKTAEDSIQEGYRTRTKWYNLRNPNFLLGAIFSF